MTLGEWVKKRYNDWKKQQEVKKQKEETKESLAKNAGFKIDGKLEHGRIINYSITDCVNPYEKIDVYDGNHWTFLCDKDYDGNVDSVWFGGVAQRIEQEGSELKYDSRHFDEATAREIMDDANKLFKESKNVLGIEEKVKNYNPVYTNPLRKR